MSPLVVFFSSLIKRTSTSRWKKLECLVGILKEIHLYIVGAFTALLLTGGIHIVHLFGLELAEHIHAVFAEKFC